MTGILVFILRALLAVSLLAFLAWAFITLWRDMQLQIQMLNARRVPPITLILEDEPGSQREFSSPEIIIGRDPSCDLQLTDGTSSSRHARLSFHHSQWWVEDLQSTNGTFLNEERIYTATVIISGDMLRFGQVVIQVAILPQL
jgi:pSer/pThr/pTyr-binding forkhead associated (FHA) protein